MIKITVEHPRTGVKQYEADGVFASVIQGGESSSLIATAYEKEKLLTMIRKGYSYEWIAEKLNRSTKSIKGRLYRNYKTERLDRIRELLK